MKFLEHELEYRRATQRHLTRREALFKLGAGFGGIGLASMLGQAGAAEAPSPLAPRSPHFAPRAKRIIQLFMPGGPSQVDTFDYKPMLAKHAGERPASVDRKSLRNTKMGLMPSPFEFKQYGRCGKWVSDIFPHVAECVDDICFLHSMHTDIAWDTGHNDIEGGHAKLARACDQAIAGLLKDLKSRGLLEDTLVLWGGEFGRAPTSEKAKGRDHDHYGYTVWMAGGGVKPGFSHGATDEFGLSAVENRVHVHDLHATILHLMGLDHERLTYRYSGRDYRLTDVHGRVVSDIIA